jgi:integrase
LTTERPPTLAEWLAIYLREVAPSRVRPNTLHSYQQHIDAHIVPALGRHRIDKLRPQHIAAFYREKSGVLAPSSVRRIHAVLRRALTVALRWGLISVNPALMVDPPSVPRHEIQPYTIDEARRLLEHVRGERLEARWLVGLSLGLRQGETLGLQWPDVDFEHKRLHVRRALRRQPDGTLALVETKTSGSTRSIPMPGPVVEALRKHRDRQDEECVAIGDLWHDSDLVFTTTVGTPIHPRNDYRSFQRIIKNADLRRVRLHDLRHTAASILLAQGVPARVVMEILGHSQISVTMNTYTHVDDTLTRVAASRMEEALWPTDS